MGEENLRRLREHKRVERNRNLAHRKRADDFTVNACGFDFASEYGSIGREFIKAHHLMSLLELKARTLTLDPKKDFTVFCLNCHRMTHRTMFVYSVEEFRARYVVLSYGTRQFDTAYTPQSRSKLIVVIVPMWSSGTCLRVRVSSNGE